MDSDPVPRAALALLEHHFQSMPPVAALQLHVAGFDGQCLRLQAPLAAHVNDKGCAFGGSLASLMTLAAWGVVTLRLHDAGIGAEVFVADTQLSYRAPLFADLHAEAWLADAAGWEDFTARLRERGRASIALDACVRLPDGGVAAECRSRYVAIATG